MSLYIQVVCRDNKEEITEQSALWAAAGYGSQVGSAIPYFDCHRSTSEESSYHVCSMLGCIFGFKSFNTCQVTHCIKSFGEVNAY